MVDVTVCVERQFIEHIVADTNVLSTVVVLLVVNSVCSCRHTNIYRYTYIFVSLLRAVVVNREHSQLRGLFLQHLVEDRSESSLSYNEFLIHIQKEMKS